MDWFSLAYISAILSAAAAVMQKKILFNLDALDFSFILSIFNAVIVLIFIGSIDFNQLNSTGVLILYGKTILGALAFWCIMLAIKNMEISGALPLMVLTPGVVAISSFILLGERINSVELLGMFFLLSGTYILEIKKGNNIISPLKVFINSNYHHYIIFAILLFTASTIIDKILLTEYQLLPFPFVVLQQIFLAINFTIIIYLRKKSIVKIFKGLTIEPFIWILIISVVTIGYRYTQIEAFKLAPVALVLSIKRTSVFFASILGGKLFSESYLFKKGIAILIMLYGAYLLS